MLIRSFAIVFGLAAMTLSAVPAIGEPFDSNDLNTITPVKHVIIIVGENRTFDHLFATYQPRPGQTVWNLASRGIVKRDGRPGPHFADAAQQMAEVTGRYAIAPVTRAPYSTLPPPDLNGTPAVASDADGPPFKTLSAAAQVETGLMPGDLPLMLKGASGAAGKTGIDTRIANSAHLPNGPYPLSPGLHDGDYAGNPTHRFFQMWQEMDCAAAAATPANPSGCRADLFPWVETSVGPGTNGAPPSSPPTHEGAVAMGFYNMAAGDLPYLDSLAVLYTLSDNYHQPIMGGTGANQAALGFGDMIYFSGADGKPATPPTSQIENPDPQPGTNNVYRNDGYGSEKTGQGGSYVNCADPAQPGVAPILDYLRALNPPVSPNCQPGAYYLVNNYNPSFLGTGTVDPAATGPFTIPPTRQNHIGDALTDAHVSWRYYGEGWETFLQDPKGELYCNICNPALFTPSVMTDPKARISHLKDTPDLYNDIADGVLPAVAFVKPNGMNDGHPASSRLDIFESFVRKIVTAVHDQRELWTDTVIFVTVDEGGGYWDSGYVQPLDFFGDGPRIPLIAVSRFSEGGQVNHAYADHISLLKFIERNWGVKPISTRSRDNLPNPIATGANPYVPTNGPAIDDLFGLFRFPNR